MLTTLASYATIAGNLQRSFGTTAAKPQVARETEYYLAHIVDVKSIDDFLGDDRLFAYAMKAFGLEDMAYAKAFMRKVLSEGIDKKRQLRQQPGRTRATGSSSRPSISRAMKRPRPIFDTTRQGTVDRYVRQTLEEDAGAAERGRAAGPLFRSARRRASPAPTASLPMRRS